MIETAAANGCADYNFNRLSGNGRNSARPTETPMDLIAGFFGHSSDTPPGLRSHRHTRAQSAADSHGTDLAGLGNCLHRRPFCGHTRVDLFHVKKYNNINVKVNGKQPFLYYWLVAVTLWQRERRKCWGTVAGALCAASRIRQAQNILQGNGAYGDVESARANMRYTVHNGIIRHDRLVAAEPDQFGAAKCKRRQSIPYSLLVR